METSPSKRVLKTLRGNPEGKVQRGQYLLAVGLDCYRHAIDLFMKLLTLGLEIKRIQKFELVILDNNSNDIQRGINYLNFARLCATKNHVIGCKQTCYPATS